MRALTISIAIIWMLLGGALQALAQGSGSAERRPGFLGVENRDLTKEEAEKLGFDAPTGVWVVRPLPGTPAEKSGVLPNDVILSVDGIEIAGSESLRLSLGNRAAGSEVRLRMLRDGRMRTMSVALAERPPEPAQKPVANPLKLMVDTGGHTGALYGLTITRDGRQIISAGDDKVVRVWDWRSGRTTRIIRGQIGEGNEGQVYALALSPDERLLAVGGWIQGDANEVRIYDFASGQLLKLLRGHNNVVVGLAFSPDGATLASGSADGTAFLWDVAGGKSRHRLMGHYVQDKAHHIFGVAFSSDGKRVITGSYDTTLMIWDVASGKRLETLRGHTDKLYAIAVHPIDGSIASGSTDGEIRIWDAAGKPKPLPGRPAGPNANVLGFQSGGTSGGNVGRLVFTPDGQYLLSTCGFSGCDYDQRVWNLATMREHSVLREHANVVRAAGITRLPDGKWLAVTGGGNNNEIRLWELATAKPYPRLDQQGKPLTGPNAHLLVGSGARVWSVGITGDGSRVAWGLAHESNSPVSRGPLIHQIGLATGTQGLRAPSPLPAEEIKQFGRAMPNHKGITLSHRRGGRDGTIYEDGTLVIARPGAPEALITRGSTDGYGHHAYTVTPDGTAIVSGGGNGFLIAYDLQGRPIAHLVGHTSTVWAIAATADGRYLVSGGTDQTVRLWPLHRLKDKDVVPGRTDGTLPPKKISPVATLLHLPVTNEWLMWTPEGYYTGSEGADRLIGWQLDKGAEQTPEYYEASQLRRQFHRPDIVEKAIRLASSEEAVRTSHGTSYRVEDLLRLPPPRLAITSPRPYEALTGGMATLGIRIDQTPDPVTRLTVRVNGTLVVEQTPDRAEGEIVLKVPLGQGENTITVIAGNRIGDTAAEVRVINRGEAPLDRRGTLWIVAVGVERYAGLGNTCGQDGKRTCDLSYSSRDAASLADTMARALGTSHTNVDAVVLSNEPGKTAPTAANVRRALSRVRNLAKETDTLVVFTAGHGVNDGFDYLFLTTDAERQGSGFDGSTVLPWVELERIVFGTKGRRFLFVDTCHSSGAYNAKLGNEAYHNDVTAFTATGQDELAVELRALQQGVFSYTIARGLGPEAKAADLNKDGIVRVEELAAYLRSRTPQLIDQHYPDFERVEQTRKPQPRLYRARDAVDHVLTRIQ